MPEPIGPWLRASRKARGLSHSQAAHDIGCSVTTLGAWERGRPPSARWAPAIARALEVNEDDFVERIAHAREMRRVGEALVLDRIDAETGRPFPPGEPMVPVPRDEAAG